MLNTRISRRPLMPPSGRAAQGCVAAVRMCAALVWLKSSSDKRRPDQADVTTVTPIDDVKQAATLLAPAWRLACPVGSTAGSRSEQS